MYSKADQKPFSFLQSILSKEEIIQYLFQSDKFDVRAYEYAIQYSAVSILTTIIPKYCAIIQHIGYPSAGNLKYIFIFCLCWETDET